MVYKIFVDNVLHDVCINPFATMCNAEYYKAKFKTDNVKIKQSEDSYSESRELIGIEREGK